MRVRIPPRPPELIFIMALLNPDKKLLAYLIGVSLGDGNLTNPNGRAVRLRVTCDKKYPLLIKTIVQLLIKVFPENKVGIINSKGCIDISLYSNQLPNLLGWKWYGGPKDRQNVGVPAWIKKDKLFIKECLRGLLQTDGSIYKDRNYQMINFVNTAPRLSKDVFAMIKQLGYEPNIQKLHQSNGKTKHTIRLAKKANKFIKEINFWKK